MRRTTISVLLFAAATASAGIWACNDSSAPKVQQPPQSPPPPPPLPPPPPPTSASFGIRPALDTLTVGDSALFVAERGDSTVDAWMLSDTSSTRILAHERGWARVLARAAGTVTLKATSHGDSGQATLVIVRSAPHDSSVGSGGWEAIDLAFADGCSTTGSDINDAGTIVGTFYGCSTTYEGGFIWSNGVGKALPEQGGWPSGRTAWAVGPSDIVAGAAYPDPPELIVWNSPDAAPSHLTPHELRHIIGVNARGDVLITTENGTNSSMVHRGVVQRSDGRVDLGDLGDSTVLFRQTEPSAWNNGGQIVGKSQVRRVQHTNGGAEAVFHGFLWQNGVLRDLGALASRPCQNVATPADCSWSEAIDINAGGVVVGTANGATRYSRAFMWKNGLMRGLGAYEGHSTRAIAINDRGQILAAMGNALGGTTTVYDTLFFYDNGRAQIIRPLEGLYGQPLLGANGEVVGLMKVGEDVHVYIWQAGQLTDLGPGWPAAINSHLEIVGTRVTNASRATLWRKKSS